MNPNDLTEVTLKYAMGWNEAIFQRCIIGAIGILVLLLVVRAFFRKNTGLVALLLWTLLGSVLLLFASVPESLVKLIISTEYMLRVRVAMGVVSAIVLLITFESVRRTRLQERYALLWVATALVILACVFFPNAVALFRAVMGMEYGTALATVALIFLAMVAFHFSISFSTMQSKQSKIAQRLATLEARLKEMEQTVQNGFKTDSDAASKSVSDTNSERS